MPWPTIFANLAGGNQPLSLFDTMFNQVAQMVALPCFVSGGPNAIQLQPLYAGVPSLSAYQTGCAFRFSTTGNSTGPVTLQYQALGFFPCYKSDTTTQVGANDLLFPEQYVAVFVQGLQGGLGGFFIENAILPNPEPTPGGTVIGLQINNNGVAPLSQINISFTELVLNQNATGQTCRITTPPFGGATINGLTNGFNGLDTGALANNAWYAIWAISAGEASNTGALLSLSFTNPTLPTGFPYKRRIGAVSTNASAQFYNFLQLGARQQYMINNGGNPPTATPIISNAIQGTYSVTSPTLAAITVGQYIPPSAKSVNLSAQVTWKGGAQAAILLAPDVNWGGTNNGPQGSNGNAYPVWNATSLLGHCCELNAPVLTSNNVGWASNAAGGALGIIGYEDNI